MYGFDDYGRAAAYYGGAGIEGGPADGDRPKDPDMASRRERRRRRDERRERVGDVWDALGFEVSAGPVKIEKEARPRGRGRGQGRGRAPSGVTVTPQIPPAVWIGAAALGVVLLTQRGGGR